jgi:hypothetical protein
MNSGKSPVVSITTATKILLNRKAVSQFNSSTEKSRNIGIIMQQCHQHITAMTLYSKVPCNLPDIMIGQTVLP